MPPRSDPVAQHRELVNLAYEAALSPTQWTPFLEKISSITRSASTLSHVDYACPDPRHTFALQVGFDPRDLRQYVDHYSALNPWLHAEPQPGQGDVVTSQRLLPDRELVRTEFYNDFLRRQDRHNLLVAVPVAAANVSTVITQIRSKRLGPFNAEEVERIRALLPHVRMAISLHQRLTTLDLERRLAGDVLDYLPFGVALFDGRGKLIRVNKAAQVVLRARDGLTLGPSGLLADRHDESVRLARLITSAGMAVGAPPVGGAMSVTRRSGSRYSIIVAPLRDRSTVLGEPSAGVVVFITDPDLQARTPQGVLESLYGLSHAEAAIAALLAQGKSLRQAADERCVSIHTVRSHLKRIFEKTGTTRQSGLVHLLLRATTFLLVDLG